MTEPSLLAASISMKEKAYRRYITSEPANTFAEAAAVIIAYEEEDFLAIRHREADSTLFIAFLFRWGDSAEEIMERPYFKALLDACTFMEGDERGRVVISPGALNFLSDGIDVAFVLTPDASTQDDAVTDAEMAHFDALLNEHIFEAGLPVRYREEMIRKPEIFPAELRQKVEMLLEKLRSGP
jgi:hypothetical protein